MNEIQKWIIKWHYNPSVLEAFNSVEHTLLLYTPLTTILCVLLLFITGNEFNIVYATEHKDADAENAKKLRVSRRSKSKLSGTNSQKSPDKWNFLSDEQFNEWLRGLTDGEGCFMIKSVRPGKLFSFRFVIYMHKDDFPMLEAISKRLKIGCLHKGDHFASYYVTSKNDLRKIFEIFDKSPLNTSKHLNYLAFKKAYYLYFNRDVKNKNSAELVEEIMALKNLMNKKRICFKQPVDHRIKITPYWLLGFVEAEGYFSVTSPSRLTFGIGQTLSEINVLKAIKEFLLSLPGSYKITRKDTNVVALDQDSKAKNEKSKPMARIQINKSDYILNVLVLFFDSLTWLSKKELDYNDWKLILTLKSQGKHFTEEGKEIISLISKRMNRNRLSTVSPQPKEIAIEERIQKLLAAPSNYEIHPNGKILIKSSGIYLKGRGNISIEVFDDEGLLVYDFDSIKECALFFGVSTRTIVRKLDNNTSFPFNGKNLIIKRVINQIF